MSAPAAARGRSNTGLWLPDLARSFDNLLLHKLRTLLTMLGMIFGVAAVLAMLSIGAGAQQEVMAFIEALGVRNLIVEARETTEFQAFQKIRTQSPGLTFEDMRAIEAAVPDVETIGARKRFAPTQVNPKPTGELPIVYGVGPEYVAISGLTVVLGRYFTEAEAAAASAVCVLGEAARVHLFGDADPLGRFVKVNEQWFQVIGVAAAQATSRGNISGMPAEDRNNLIYVPTTAAILRLADNYWPTATRSTASFSDSVPKPTSPPRRPSSGASSTAAIGEPATTQSSSRRSSWPSSSGRSGSSTS